MQTIRSKMILALVVPLAVLVPVAAVTLVATNSSRHTSQAAGWSADILQPGQRAPGWPRSTARPGSGGSSSSPVTAASPSWTQAGPRSTPRRRRCGRPWPATPSSWPGWTRWRPPEQQWRTQVGEPQITARRANGPEAIIERAGTGKALKDQVRAADAERVAAERKIFDTRIAANDRAANLGPASPPSSARRWSACSCSASCWPWPDTSPGAWPTSPTPAEALAAGDLTRRVGESGHYEIAACPVVQHHGRPPRGIDPGRTPGAGKPCRCRTVQRLHGQGGRRRPQGPDQPRRGRRPQPPTRTSTGWWRPGHDLVGHAGPGDRDRPGVKRRTGRRQPARLDRQPEHVPTKYEYNRQTVA